MLERQLPRVQRDPAAAVLGLQNRRRPVLAVPHDRHPPVGKLDPQLMTSPRRRPQFELAAARDSSHNTISHARFFPPIVIIGLLGRLGRTLPLAPRMFCTSQIMPMIVTTCSSRMVAIFSSLL